jgi:hypothetical protein
MCPVREASQWVLAVLAVPAENSRLKESLAAKEEGCRIAFYVVLGMIYSVSQSENGKGILATCLGWLKERWLGAITAALLVVSQRIASRFEGLLSQWQPTTSETLLLLQLIFLLLISSVYFLVKWLLARKAIESIEEEMVFEDVEIRKSRRTGNTWKAFCPKCKMPVMLPEQSLNDRLVCSGDCGWKSSVSANFILMWIGIWNTPKKKKPR